MSGDHNMVIAVTTIWDEVVRDMLNTARQQLLRRPDDEDVLRRVEELENEWRQRNTLGESPYDMVPECQAVGGSTYCRCSALFNDVTCSAHNARKGLLASTEAQAPLLFSGVFAVVVVSAVIGVVSLHTSTAAPQAEPWSVTEWAGICVSYVLLWIVLSLSSFIRHLWNILNFGLVMLDIIGAPSSDRPPSTAPEIANIKKRRLATRLERILAIVLATDHPSESDLTLLEDAISLDGLLVGLTVTVESILGETLVKNGRELLSKRREERRRTKELADMRDLATTLFTKLAEIEATVRTEVDSPMSNELRQNAQRELIRADKYVHDGRLKQHDDVMRVGVKFLQLKTLVELREKLQQALSDPRDDYFESVVSDCRAARIQDSKTVKARLKAINQPRAVLAELTDALQAATLDAAKLHRALASAQSKDCPSRPDLVAFSEKAGTLLSALNSLEQAKVNGRKAHAQLLVAPDNHDISHIAKLENQLAAFSQVCMDTRGSLPEPQNVGEVRGLLAKWKREEGPSRQLKAAMAGSDLELLRQAIPAAKEAGIGIKAAKKRLAALEQNERIKAELEAALVAQDTKRLKEAVMQASKAGVEIAEAKAVLDQLTKRDSCRDALVKAIQSNREEKLQTAIAEARKHDVDCSAAQQQLEAVMQKRLIDSKLKEEARAALREDKAEDLRKLLATNDCALTELADATRTARVVGADVTKAAEVLTKRINDNLTSAMEDPNKDMKRLTEAIRSVAYLDGLSGKVDIAPAKATVERWLKQGKLSKQLKSAADIARKLVDDRTLSTLEQTILSASPLLDDDNAELQNAQMALKETRALLELNGANRNCRVKHEQSCMMHPRVDSPEAGVPEYLVAFRKTLEDNVGKVPQVAISEMNSQTDTWEKEAELIFDLREAVANKDAKQLKVAIKRAVGESKSINVEPPKRTLDKLQKQAEKQVIAEELQKVFEGKMDIGKLRAAIQTAKAAGVDVSEATSKLYAWQNDGRRVLAAARATRDRSRMREALEATAVMGMSGSPEWVEMKRFVEGRAKPVNPPKIVPSSKTGSSSSSSSAAAAAAAAEAAAAAAAADAAKHPRWKTEICTHWLTHGYCSYGKERCNFAHGDEDLRKPVFSAEADGFEFADSKEVAAAKSSANSTVNEPPPAPPSTNAWRSGSKPIVAQSSLPQATPASSAASAAGVPMTAAASSTMTLSSITQLQQDSQDSFNAQYSSMPYNDLAPGTPDTYHGGSEPWDSGKAAGNSGASSSAIGQQVGSGGGAGPPTSQRDYSQDAFGSAGHRRNHSQDASFGTAEAVVSSLFDLSVGDSSGQNQTWSSNTTEWATDLPTYSDQQQGGIFAVAGANKKSLRADVTAFTPSSSSAAAGPDLPGSTASAASTIGGGGSDWSTDIGGGSSVGVGGSDWSSAPGGAGSSVTTDWGATSLGAPASGSSLSSGLGSARDDLSSNWGSGLDSTSLDSEWSSSGLGGESKFSSNFGGFGDGSSTSGGAGGTGDSGGFGSGSLWGASSGDSGSLTSRLSALSNMSYDNLFSQGADDEPVGLGSSALLEGDETDDAFLSGVLNIGMDSLE